MENAANQLVVTAFEKAGEESQKSSFNGRAVYLQQVLEENYRCFISEKSLKRYYKGKGTPKPEVLKALASYLDFEDFQQYLKQHPEPKPETPKNRRREILLYSLIVILATMLVWKSFDTSQEDCMVWKDDHFEKIACSGAISQEPFNKAKLENLKKIEVCDTTTFFERGQPVVWYDKSNNVLTYFSYHGIHPENRKTLKPITRTIIEAHVEPCTILAETSE